MIQIGPASKNDGGCNSCGGVAHHHIKVAMNGDNSGHVTRLCDVCLVRLLAEIRARKPRA